MIGFKPMLSAPFGDQDDRIPIDFYLYPTA